MNKSKNILVTGCCGFIGSHLVRYFCKKYPEYNIVGFDKLTYCGIKENISDVIEKCENFRLLEGDICSESDLEYTFKKYEITDVIHLAAESHVDNSIDNPMEFVMSNVVGTVTLLNICKKYWSNNMSKHRFYHVSTDEVYGAFKTLDNFFVESDKYNPNSPYSASKASSDHFVRAYGNTYGLNYVISNCSNNFGTNQYKEKFIPKIIDCLVNNKPIPIYGNGENIRNWIWVNDHISAIDLIFHKSKSGSTYNIGGNREISNINLVKMICEQFADIVGIKSSWCTSLITFVEDRKGHDFRYAISSGKLRNRLKWKPVCDYYNFENYIKNTVRAYVKKLDSPDKWYHNSEFKK